MSFFSPRSKNRTHIWDTPHFLPLIESHQVSSDCILIAYECTSLYINLEFNELIKAVDEALPQEVSWPKLDKSMLKTHVVQLLQSYSQTTASYSTTNFTTKLSEPPWARSHYPKYVTYGFTKSWNSRPKTHHTRTKSALMPVSEIIGT